MLLCATVLALVTFHSAISRSNAYVGDEPGFMLDANGGSPFLLPNDYNGRRPVPPNLYPPRFPPANLYPNQIDNNGQSTEPTPPNPCPMYFQYGKNESTGTANGLVFIRPSHTSNTYELELNMTVLDAVQQTDGLKISVLSGQQEILNGGLIKYAVTFPYSSKQAVPYLTQIKFNGQSLCTGPAPPFPPGQVSGRLWSKSTIRVRSPFPPRQYPYPQILQEPRPNQGSGPFSYQMFDIDAPEPSDGPNAVGSGQVQSAMWVRSTIKTLEVGPNSEPSGPYGEPSRPSGEPSRPYGEPSRPYGEPSRPYGEPSRPYGEPIGSLIDEPSRPYGEPSRPYGEPLGSVIDEPSRPYGEQLRPIYSEPSRPYDELTRPYGEPSRPYGEPSRPYGEQSRPVYGEPFRLYGELSRPSGEPSRPYGEPSRPYGEPSRSFGVLTGPYSEPYANLAYPAVGGLVREFIREDAGNIGPYISLIPPKSHRNANGNDVPPQQYVDSQSVSPQAWSSNSPNSDDAGLPMQRSDNSVDKSDDSVPSNKQDPPSKPEAGPPPKDQNDPESPTSSPPPQQDDPEPSTSPPPPHKDDPQSTPPPPEHDDPKPSTDDPK